MENMIWLLVAFVVYAIGMILIGASSFKKNENMSDYFLGGRKLGSWVAAISAQASDMSGWLLMGLPGAVYAAGTGQIWIAIGLAVGTALNWLFVAKRLRRYTIVAGDSITIPQYFENRLRDDSGILRLTSAVFIIIFFTVYAASGFVAGGTLFSQVFGIDYKIALLIGVALILTYTFLGGFLAVCTTDLIQGLLMLTAILAVPILAVVSMGGLTAVTDKLPPHFLDPMINSDGQPISALSIISQLAWGLGYFGMPHILVRFIAIESETSLKKSQKIALVWVVLSLFFAALIGVVGAAFLPGLTNPETVFIQMTQKIFMATQHPFFLMPFIGGLFLCGILAAIMSTADSQLLLTASSISSDIYKTYVNKTATEKTQMWFSRGAVAVVAIVAYFMATNPESRVMDLVSNAWAGFGAAFGPIVLLSLYWSRVNRIGGIAGIFSGGCVVILWDYIPFLRTSNGLETLGKSTGLYSLVPGFAISFLCIVVFSLLTKAPSKEMLKEYDVVATGNFE